MKKTLFIFCFAIVGIASQAQFGVKAGLNVASWGGEDADDDAKALLGVYGGAFYNIKASEMISVQPEVVWSTQGAKYDDGKIVLSYINVTPLVRFNTTSGFFAGVGPQIGFLASAKAKPDSGPSTDVKDSFKSTEIAAAIAAGYELPNGFGFYARYNFGLTTIADVSDVKVFNRVFQVGLRYVINVGGSASK